MSIIPVSTYYDLITPDGIIVELDLVNESTLHATVEITNIPFHFIGFFCDEQYTFFNLKSTIAQLGVNGIGVGYTISKKLRTAEIHVTLTAVDDLGKILLQNLHIGSRVGKLFSAEPSRRVRDPFYLTRMFGRSDRQGRPLLSLGGLHGSDDLVLEKIDGRAVAFLKLQEGRFHYDDSIRGFIPTLTRALSDPSVQTRKLIHFSQVWHENEPRTLHDETLLLVRTIPLHIRTVFARVIDELLPSGFHHTTASVLQPDTFASGDVYELFGNSDAELHDIPLEFYTLEPYREHVFFEDRDQLLNVIEDKETLFSAFTTAPQPKHYKCATFIVKGEQLLNLKAEDWNMAESAQSEFPGFFHKTRQALMAENYIKQQPSYPFLKAIEDGIITSQGILLTRYFPSPLMKRYLLSEYVHRNVKGIYFEKPSRSHGEFFSHEDRSFLLDLAKFGIPIYWIDERSHNILQYVPKPNKDSGMFVPLDKVETFISATTIGIYGSNLIEGNFEQILREILQGLLELKTNSSHNLLNPNTPLAMVTGGGPGVMRIGNKVAKELNILSCANIVDFTTQGGTVVNEQQQNPYIDAKMTFRLDKLVERQAEFHLDLPIFLTGGIGTDFEYALEEVRRKVGSCQPTPILLVGPKKYWQEKITARFKNNLEHGTISGSEWVSNCFYCVETAKQALSIYQSYFLNFLAIGKQGKIFEEGFCSIPPPTEE